MRSDLDRLNDILAAIAKIEERAADRLAFQNDEMLQVWVIHHLQVIGEAARGVSQPVRDRHLRGPMAADCRVAKYPGARILRSQLGPDLGVDSKGPSQAGGAGSTHPSRDRSRSPLQRVRFACRSRAMQSIHARLESAIQKEVSAKRAVTFTNLSSVRHTGSDRAGETNRREDGGSRKNFSAIQANADSSASVLPLIDSMRTTVLD
jgi:hypothetical protein